MRNCLHYVSVAALAGLCVFAAVAAETGPPAAGEKQPDGAAGLRLSVSYSLQKPGFVSAALYNAEGQMVRPLIYGEKQEAGEHRLSWDGLDRYGQPQPPGVYEWRMLRTPGFTREFLLDVGTQVTWAPHDYWPGNHDGPSAVMVDEQGDLYVGSVSSEGPPCVIKLTQDGSRLFWSTGTWGFTDGLQSMARIGEVLYLLRSGNLEILRADIGGKFYGHPTLRRFPDKGEPFADLRREDDKAKKQAGPMHLAGGKDFLVVCCTDYDEVRLLWPKDDAFAKTESLNVPKPVASTVAPDGRVFVVCPGKIVALDIANKTTKTVVSDPELKAPGQLAYDPASDDLIVANGNHLRRYHVPDGKRVAIYGRADNAVKYGVYNPLEFGPIRSVAADGKGGFFTVEHSPRRVAHFRGREKHELIQQWIGGMAWAPSSRGCPRPASTAESTSCSGRATRSLSWATRRPWAPAAWS